MTTGMTMHSIVSSPVSPRRVTVALTSCFPTILRNGKKGEDEGKGKDKKTDKDNKDRANPLRTPKTLPIRVVLR